MGLVISVGMAHVRAVRGPAGYYFDLEDVLNAAGVPQSLSKDVVGACRESGQAVEADSAGPLSVSVDGLRDYIARTRGGIPADEGVRTADQRDAAKFMDRLETCADDCARWIAAQGRADGPEAGTGGDGPGYAGTDWVAFLEDPYGGTEPVPDGPARGPCRPWDSLIPKAVAGSGVADALLDRLPMLCRTFGISQFMDRERQLAWIIWLMAFRGEPLAAPEDKDAEAAFLWRGMARRDVRGLVGSAMVD